MSRIHVNRQLQQTACLLGIGLCIGGAFLGIPDTYNTWKFVREPAGDLFGQRRTETSIYRIDEEVPTKRKPYKSIQGQSQRKLTGMVLLFFGGNLAWYFGQMLADEFEIIEKRCYTIRQSEFLIEDTTLRTGTEVQQTMIDMDMLNKLAYFQNGFRPDNVTYLPPDTEEESKVQDGDSDKYPLSANGFFMWLLDRNYRQAKVRDICQKSFNNSKLPAEQIRGFVEELIVQKLAEWMDESKSEFRLLNVSS
ncbi:MAG: hypothetical protein PUP93_28595 [Rhizonema sp. NSF051]|nr:hypothetical protein [Rhizonema sp. NSF051]